MAMEQATMDLIVKVIFSMIELIVIGLMIPLVKSKIGEIKYNKLTNALEIFIRCAEQNFGEVQWKEKKINVLEKAVKTVEQLGITMTVDELSDRIDALVNEIKYSNEYTKNKEK